MRSALAPVVLLACLACSDVEPITPCEPMGSATPLCGWQNPEDLAALPDGRHVVVSEYGGMGGEGPGVVSLLDLETGQRRVLYRGGGDARPGAGPWGASDCPGPPSEAFSPHGIHFARRADGRMQLLVVQHGGRESIEMFEVIGEGGGATRWSLAWRGCAVPPEGSWLNSVVATPEGGLLVTHMMARRGAIGQVFEYAKGALLGMDTGHVLAWDPGAGFAPQPGTEGLFPNGIELSADGETIFVNYTLGSELRRVDRASGRVEASVSIPSPDNARWAPDGRLLVASLRAETSELLACAEIESGACPAAFAIVSVDPQTLEHEVIYEGGRGTPSGAGTVGLRVSDGSLLVGTFAGDRIVRVAPDAG